MRSYRAWIAGLMLSLAASAAWAHGGEFYKPPPPEKRLKKPPEDTTPRGGGEATTPSDAPGPTTGGGSKLGPDDWKSWWTTQRTGLTPVRTTDVETPSTAAPSQPTERDAAIASLRRATDDPDEDVATAALVALGRIGDRDSEARLIAVLLDERRARTLRESAACGLAFLGRANSDPGTARQALERVALLSQGDARLRAIAVYALGLRLETESAEVLAGLAVASRTDRQVACAAATSLGVIRTPECVDTLLRLLEKGRDGDDDPATVRIYAAHGLARCGDASGVVALRKAASDADAGVRRAAALALGALAGSGDDETYRVLRRMVDQDREVGCRDVALLSIGRQGNAAARRILEDAARGGRQVHATYALTALGFWARRTGDPSAAAPVRAALAAGTEPALRTAACFAVALARDREAAPVVLRIAEGRNDPWLRTVAIASVPSIATRDEAGSLLIGLLNAAEPPEIRREAATALGVLGEASASAVLGELAEKGERMYVRAAATVALGRVGGPGAVERLRRTLDTPGREGMLRALSAVGMGLLLESRRTLPLHVVADDLDWDVMTDAVAELMSIL
jgi:HEAT repeat protein